MLCSLRTVLLWQMIRLGSTPEGIAICEENISCRNHRDTKRNKQHCRLLYDNIFFKTIVFISPQKKLHKCIEYNKEKWSHEIHSFDREPLRVKDGISLIYLDDIRETTTDLCHRNID